MTACFDSGGVNVVLVGPKIAKSGLSNAAPMCMSPESLLKMQVASDKRSTVRSSVRRPAKFTHSCANAWSI